MCGDNDTDDFLAYTRTWIDKVNRGGLFPLNNDSFRLFVCEVKHHLYSADSHAFKESIVKHIMQNEDVAWNLTLVSQCIDAESDAIELLEAIVTLWVAVRGFSITATWMTVYKSKCQESRTSQRT